MQRKVDCRYFYGDYFRGREKEECRLIGNKSRPYHWSIELCRSCPVPGIFRANACEKMILNARVNPGIIGIGRRVVIQAYCIKAQIAVKEPEIGCGLCHPLNSVFTLSGDN